MSDRIPHHLFRIYTLAMFLGSFLVCLGCFLVARWLWADQIVFTQGLMIIGFVFVTLFLLMRLARKNEMIDYVTSTVLGFSLLLGLLTFYAFLITVPTLLDRSISIYVIAELDADPDDRMSEVELNSYFLDNYVDGDYQMQKRITEQVAIGNLRKVGDAEVLLTSRGRLTASINRLLARAFNIDSRYTDRSISETD
jgi:hypothetical protein